MNALIIYCSQYNNNTDAIAKIFSEKLQCQRINIHNTKDVNIDDYQVIGFGSGVYRESLSTKLLTMVKEMNLKGKSVFVFSTSGAGMKYYNNGLIKLLETKGAINKGSFACKGSFVAKDFTNNKIFDFMGKLSQGHPNSKDIEKAERFIKKIEADL